MSDLITITLTPLQASFLKNAILFAEDSNYEGYVDWENADTEALYNWLIKDFVKQLDSDVNS